MSKTDPVEVAVDIIDGFTKELEKLEKKLDKIDSKKLDVSLDIDDAEIEKIEARLKELERDLETDLNIDVDARRAQAMKAWLQRDTFSTHHIDVDQDRLENIVAAEGASVDTPNRGLSSSERGAVNDLINEDVRRATNAAVGKHGFGGARPTYNFGIGERRGTGFPARPSAQARSLVSRMNRFQKAAIRVQGLGKNLDLDSSGIRDSMRSVNQRLKALIPSMHKWWRLVAIVLPLMITLAGAAAGVAVAFGAVAAAGGAMVGLGLLGYGDSLAESMENASRRVGELKEELFEVFQPAAQTFQPFTARLFSRLPYLTQRFVNPLQRLQGTGFDDFFMNALEGAVDWTLRLMDTFDSLSMEIQAITKQFGMDAGNSIITFLRWAVEEAYENYDVFAALARIVGQFVFMLYKVSKAISFVVTAFGPLVDLLTWIVKLVGSKWVAAVLAAAAGGWALATALGAVLSLMGAIKGLAIAQAFLTAAASVGTLAGALGAAYGVLQAFVAQLTLAHILTGGAFLLGAAVVGYGAVKAMSNTTPDAARTVPAGGGGGGTTINIHGDVGRKEYQRMKDEFPGLYREQRNLEEATTRNGNNPRPAR